MISVGVVVYQHTVELLKMILSALSYKNFYLIRDKRLSSKLYRFREGIFSARDLRVNSRKAVFSTELA